VNRQDIIIDLVRLADYLDGKKIEKGANYVDRLIGKIAAQKDDEENVDVELGSLKTRVINLERELNEDDVDDFINLENESKDMESD
jgi:hypothetical protein